jgi:regulator of cell morphogenesis and NO signaling
MVERLACFAPWASGTGVAWGINEPRLLADHFHSVGHEENRMQQISRTSTLGTVAARFPAAIRVFLEHDIDFCCGGSRTLEEACEEQHLDPEAVAEEIQRSSSTSGAADAAVDWLEEPLDALIDHILLRFHRPLVKDLPTIESLLASVFEAHRDVDEKRLTELVRVFFELKQELTAHMAKEERVLFPWLRSGKGRTATEPIRVMLMEHEHAADKLGRIRELTSGFELPSYACNKVEVLYAALARLDRDLREHIHLENNVLFPRALRG